MLSKHRAIARGCLISKPRRRACYFFEYSIYLDDTRREFSLISERAALYTCTREISICRRRKMRFLFSRAPHAPYVTRAGNLRTLVSPNFLARSRYAVGSNRFCARCIRQFPRGFFKTEFPRHTRTHMHLYRPSFSTHRSTRIDECVRSILGKW